MNDTNETLWSSLFALVFGVFVLGYLIVIDRQEWFHIRPVSGVAMAMADAAHKNPANRDAAPGKD